MGVINKKTNTNSTTMTTATSKGRRSHTGSNQQPEQPQQQQQYQLKKNSKKQKERIATMKKLKKQKQKNQNQNNEEKSKKKDKVSAKNNNNNNTNNDDDGMKLLDEITNEEKKSKTKVTVPATAVYVSVVGVVDYYCKVGWTFLQWLHRATHDCATKQYHGVQRSWTDRLRSIQKADLQRWVMFSFMMMGIFIGNVFPVRNTLLLIPESSLSSSSSSSSIIESTSSSSSSSTVPPVSSSSSSSTTHQASTSSTSASTSLSSSSNNNNNNGGGGGAAAARSATGAGAWPASLSHRNKKHHDNNNHEELSPPPLPEEGVDYTTATSYSSPPLANANLPPTEATLLVSDSAWTVLATYPTHHTDSFTQGLEVMPFGPARTVLHHHQQEQQQERRTAAAAAACEGADNKNACHNDSISSSKDDDDKDQDKDDAQRRKEDMLLVESTGNYGNSTMKIWNVYTGEIIKEHAIGTKFFGEGICRYTNSIIDDDGNELDERELYAQLTWRDQTILIYDAVTLELLKTVTKWPSPTFKKEGWGITWDPIDKIFYVSDGSYYLHVWNADFVEIPDTRITVHVDEMIDKAGKVHLDRRSDRSPMYLGQLNELEYDITTNTILANKLMEDMIVRIDPRTGLVLKIYYFNLLYPKEDRASTDDIFNGIAIVPDTNGQEWFVTGKYWSNIYHLRITE